MALTHVNGIDIAYLDEGAGPPVLLIHGFASNRGVNWVDPGWVRFLVGAGFRVIALDNRGHGESEKLYAPEDYRLAVMAEDARALLDSLGVARASLIGYSMGARISTLFALTHPGRVERLVLGGHGGNLIRPIAGRGPISAALLAPSVNDVSNPTARTFRAFADQTKSDLKALAACVKGANDPITAEMVGRIAAPTLIVVGEEDVIGGPAEDLARLMPAAVPLTIKARNHMNTVGDRRFKEAALAFLKGEPLPAASAT